MSASQPHIYLASSSPRRRELLHQIGVQFDVLVFRIGERGEDADVDEALHADEKAGHYVERLALTKASAGVKRLLWRKLPRQPVLAADTVIEIDDKIIRKPTDINDACDILQQLSGRSHRVLTAVAISDGEKIRSRISTSEVRFKTLSEDDIHHYIKTGEPMDKAGAYGIQGFAATFIEEIRGSYSGIMGLPLFETAALLTVFDYPL
ncbi:Maf-like protein [Betaproteobacteria bacterium]|nr:Maf-like protein [Betaproteobacteria bacterium]GHU08874.1 Maf-like protein [Betaproteobacteria bacterium]GHU20350.1 Maf-like protein [Betaproteobacteria bacterium]GHU25173.1 Maf-like protein [Betaproteobacteria bacterium]GHU33385.1 Maf-like protein [Betaproteobacteria bacterium]